VDGVPSSRWPATDSGARCWATRWRTWRASASSSARPLPSRGCHGAWFLRWPALLGLLALATLSVWRRPLPKVLKEYVLDPIGASNSWRWYGYENSWIVVDGEPMQSVTGGGHWGGGMFINAMDMARFGYLTLRRGKWKDRQILSESWVRMALTPTPAQPTYGFMNWFLNTDRKYIPSAPASAFVHIGNGLNMIYVDPENDLVAVVRWIDNKAMDEFVKRLLAAVARK